MPVQVTRDGAAAAHTTLDVGETQVLLRLTNGQYEHNVLLRRVSAAVWIVAGPDLDVTAEDLSTEPEIVPLTRSGQFPLAGRPFSAFDHLGEAELNGLRARAAQLAEVLGGPSSSAGAPSDSAWLFADTGFSLFGTEVPATIISDAAAFKPQDAAALVSADDGHGRRWTFAERVVPKDKDEWVRDKREGGGHDPRLLVTDALPNRVLPIGLAVQATSKKAALHPNFAGANATSEVLGSMESCGLEPAGFVADFLTKSGISPTSGLAAEYAYLIHAIFLMLCVDRIDGRATASMEHMCRRVLQIQRAVKKNPKSPDFGGLDAYMRHAELPMGMSRSPLFDQYIMEQQKVEGKVLQNSRLNQEEQDKVKNQKPKNPGK